MKHFLSILLLFSLSTAFCQSTKEKNKNEEELIILPSSSATPRDSSAIRMIKKETEKQHRTNTSEIFIIGKKSYKKGGSKIIGGHRSFEGHSSGFSLGFVNFTELPQELNFLELNWGGSFAAQLNIAKYDISLVPRNNFGIVTGIGFEYQRLRFNDDNITITKQDGHIQPVDIIATHPQIQEVTRSCLKNFYLTIPLTLEIQFPAAKREKMYIAAGVMGGLRLHSKTKIVYRDNDDDKFKKKGRGNFNMSPFKADAIARIGYQHVNVWGSYTLTNMFRNGSMTDGLHLYTIGLGITI